MNSKKKPPCLEGYLFNVRNQNDELWSLRLETNEYCNFLCKYCYSGATNKGNSIHFEKIKKLIEQSIPLGLKSVVFIGPGEPMLYPEILEVFAYLKNLKIISVLITNGTIISEEIAKKLFDMNVSILMKYDSMNPDVQDYLAGKKGAGKRIRGALSFLQKAGYGNEQKNGLQKLGLSFVTTKINFLEVFDFWHFCRQNGIFPNVEKVGEEGRAIGQKKLLIDSNFFLQLKHKLSEIDRNEFGYSWTSSMPLPGIGCNQLLYSCYISLENKVTPCAGVAWGLQCDRDIASVWYSDVFLKLRHTAKNEGCLVDGKYCWGCRGSAFNHWIQRGISPEKAVTMIDPECLYCNVRSGVKP